MNAHARKGSGDVRVDSSAATSTELRLIDVPPRYFPEKVGPGSFDPDTLRTAAQAHCRHSFDHSMEIKAWVVLYLLDVFDAALDAADWHEGKSGHIADRNVVRAVRGEGFNRAR